MSQKDEVSETDEMRPEYDFSGAVRGKYYERYRAGTNVVVLDSDVAQGTGVAAVHIYRSNAVKSGSWFSMRGGWAVPLPPEAIQKALDDKEAKLTSYRKKADVVWLGLTVLGTASSKFLVSEAAVRTRYRSSFDRAFLVDLSRERVHELSLVSWIGCIKTCSLS